MLNPPRPFRALPNPFARPHFPWGLATAGLNILVLVGLALGLELPAPGVVSYFLAYMVLYAAPGYLALRILFIRERFDPISTLSFSVVIGAGALSGIVMAANFTRRLPFETVLLIHAGWQVAALVWLLWQRRHTTQQASAQPTRQASPGSVALVYAVVAVVVIGAAIYGFAAFDIEDRFYLGGADYVSLTNNINWIYNHPAEYPTHENVHIGLSAKPRLFDTAWAHEQALIAHIAGLTPLEVMETYATAPLLALMFAALFALAYEVTRRIEVALLSLIFALVVMLVKAATIGYLQSKEIFLIFSGWALTKTTEDKTLVTFLFIPAAVALALYLVDRSPSRTAGPLWRRLLPWAAVVLAMVAIVGTHPIGVAQFGIIIGGYLLVRWLANPSMRALLILVGLAVLLLPAAALSLDQLAEINLIKDSLDWASADLNYGGVWHIRVGANGAYILHPLHIGTPVLVIGVGLGLLAITRIKQDRSARYLFAATAAPVALAFVPYLASTVGNVVMPHSLDRFLWLLPVGLSIAAACWWVVDRIGELLPWQRARQLAAIAPLILAAAVAVPTYHTAGAKLLDRSHRPAWPEYTTPQSDDLVTYFQSRADFDHPILAPAEVSTHLFLTLSDAYVLGAVNGYLALQSLYENPWWGETTVTMLQDFEPDYLVVENGSHQQTFARLQQAQYTLIYQNARYTVYQTTGEWVLTPTDTANSLVAHLAGTTPNALINEYDSAVSSRAGWLEPALLYVKALAQDAEDYRAIYGLAFVMAQAGYFGDAETLYHDLLTKFPDDGNVQAGLAGVLWQQDRIDEALDVLAAHTDPATLRALLDAPYLGAMPGDMLEATLEAWKDYPSFITGPHASRELAGRLLAERGDRANAIHVIEHIPDEYRTPEDLQLLGSLYTIEGDIDRALAVYDSDGGRSPVIRALYHMTRGHQAMQTGDFNTARSAYRQAIDAHETAATWVFLGRTYEALGKLDKAERAFQEAAGRPLPGNFWGEAELQRFYSGQGRAEEAQEAYRRATEILAVAGIPPYPTQTPPAVVSPLDGIAESRRVNIGVPGAVTLASYGIAQRTLDADNNTASVTLTWAAYDLSSPAPWWQIKVTDPGGAWEAGTYSQATLTPEGGMARWTFPVDVSQPNLPPPVIGDVQAVAIVPAHAAGSFAYRVGQIMLKVPPPPDEVPTVLTDYDFGGQLTLYGYTIPDIQPREPIDLTLFWEVVTPPALNLTLFVHVFDADGNAVTQIDKPPGPYPTSLWEAGARVAGTYRLELPDDAAPGQYQLLVGLYEPGTFDRLEVPGYPNNIVPLAEIQIDEVTHRP